MIKKTVIILIIGLVSTYISYSRSSNNNNVEITYVANEGFLIKVFDKTILIDALFGAEEYGFCDIPDSAQIESMLNAKGNYKNINLIASTHRHRDHFHAPFIIEHLSNNRTGKYISCKQSIIKIKETDNYTTAIKNQLVEFTPDSLTYKDTVINGIKIRAFRLSHGPYYVHDPETGKRINKHQNIQNLGFLFNINGIKIFHSGDSSPACKKDYAHFKLDKENIDIAMLGRVFMWSSESEGINIIKNFIRPKHIILMHIQHDRIQKFLDIADEMKKEFPDVKVFEKRMETKNYTIE